MYFSAVSLRKLARNYYLPDAEIQSEPYRTDGSFPLADVAVENGSIIRLSHVGPARLCFHCHDWSGSILVRDASGLREIDLFSIFVDERWIDLAGEREAMQTSTIFCGMGTPHRDAKAKQTWFLGAAFEQLQPWMPLSQPISEFADSVLGQVGSFIVPSTDAVIGASIKHTGVWASKDIDLFKSHVAEGDTVFDIGANIGHHTVFFSNAVGERGRVIAFEPQTFIYRFACANLAINNCSNVIIHQLCLGEDDGEVRMDPIAYDLPNNFGALGVSLTGSDSETAGELVPVRPLDTLIELGMVNIDRIDFVKIDVQSFELYVLRGALRSFARFRPIIFLEISPYWMLARGYDYKEIYALLKSLGYRFEHFFEGAGIVDEIREWSGHKSEEWDVLCIPA